MERSARVKRLRAHAGRGERDIGKRIGAGVQMLTVPEAAFTLNISSRSAWRMISAGELACVRLGHSVRVPVAAIDSMVKGAA